MRNNSTVVTDLGCMSEDTRKGVREKFGYRDATVMNLSHIQRHQTRIFFWDEHTGGQSYNEVLCSYRCLLNKIFLEFGLGVEPMTAVLAFALKTDITVYVVVGDYYVNLRGDVEKKTIALCFYTFWRRWRKISSFLTKSCGQAMLWCAPP